MTGLRDEPGADGWEAIADGWAERMRTGTDSARRWILDDPHLSLLGDVTGKRVLDAGCGEGRFARMLAERGAKVTAIDFSKRMIELAQAAIVEGDAPITYVHGSMTDLSVLKEGDFDIVVAYLSIIDVLDYQPAITEIARVLRPQGQFLFSIVHPCFFTPGSEWEPRKPGTVPIWDKDKLYRKVDNYFPASEVRFRMWPTAPAETINYHRPLTDYASALRRAGLLIRDIVEPLPAPDLVAQLDYLREHLRAPNFMIIDCVKVPA
jgi:SAM-dependent methyltransferase